MVHCSGGLVIGLFIGLRLEKFIGLLPKISLRYWQIKPRPERRTSPVAIILDGGISDLPLG